MSLLLLIDVFGTCGSNHFPVFREMQAFVCVALVAALCGLTFADEKGDVGTVIGIDLGTTYSWFDD
jgi:hypothetical protein